jgi:hypothetical protein
MDDGSGDGLTNFVGLGQTELLSVTSPAVTVRRLWTGAEAINVNLMIDMAMLANTSRLGDGTNKRLRWPESLVTFRHPV